MPFSLPQWVEYLFLSLFAHNKIVIEVDSKQEREELKHWIINNLRGFLIIEYGPKDIEEPFFHNEESVLILYLISLKQATKFLLVHKGSVNMIRQKYPFIFKGSGRQGTI